MAPTPLPKTAESVTLATVLARSDDSTAPEAPVKDEGRSQEYMQRLQNILKQQGITTFIMGTPEKAPAIFKALGETEAAADKYLPEWKKPRIDVVIAQDVPGTPAAYTLAPALPGKDGILIVSPSVSERDYANTRFIVGHEYGHGMMQVNKDDLPRLQADPCFAMPGLKGHLESMKDFIQSQPGIPAEHKDNIVQEATYKQMQELDADRLSVLMSRDSKTPTKMFSNDDSIAEGFQGQYDKLLRETRERDGVSGTPTTPKEIAEDTDRKEIALSRMHIPKSPRLEALTPPQECRLDEKPVALPTPPSSAASEPEKTSR